MEGCENILSCCGLVVADSNDDTDTELINKPNENCEIALTTRVVSEILDAPNYAVSLSSYIQDESDNCKKDLENLKAFDPKNEKLSLDNESDTVFKSSARKKSAIIDSESETECVELDEVDKTKNQSSLNIVSNVKGSKNTNKLSDIIGKKSGDKVSDEHHKSLNGNTTKNEKDHVKTINKIKSKTQKMHREQHFIIPYHKPRKVTFEEFMGRKSIAILQSKKFPIKMNEDQLKQYFEYCKQHRLEMHKLFLPTEKFSSGDINNPESMMKIKKTVSLNMNANDGKTLGNAHSFLENENLEASQTYKNNNKSILQENANTGIGKMSKNMNRESNNKIQIISNIKIAPGIKEPILNIKHLKQLILDDNELNKNDRPILKKDSEIIDFGCYPSSTMSTAVMEKSRVDDLIEKCVKSNQKKSNVLGGINIFKDLKPGVRFFELQNKLKEVIDENRLTNLKKKIENYKKDMEIVSKICDEEDNEEDNEDKDLSSENENDHDINYINEEDKVKDHKKSQIESDADLIYYDDDESDKGSYENNKSKQFQKYTDLKPFKDNLNDEKTINLKFNENQNFNGSMLNLSMKSGETDNIPIQTLCDEECILEDELMQLCSGNFEKSQLTSENYLRNEENRTINCCPNEKTDAHPLSGISNEDGEDLTCSKQIRKNKNKYHSDDDNEAIISSEIESEDEKCSLHRNLIYEDDENESSDYTLEQNEIPVKISKKNSHIASEYIENEAELSESDWDSADEDERNLDKYDIELGDEDEYDQDKLQNELARIHMTKLMDRDASQIKKIEEMLFVDDENHGLGRQKQFRWKTVNDSFTLDSDITEEDAKFIKEVEDEKQWRKMKYEREKVLSGLHRNESFLSPDINFAHKIKIISPTNVKMLPKTDRVEGFPFLISKSSTNRARGSFLNRDNNNLSIFSNSPKFLQNEKRKLTSLECNASKKFKWT